MLIDNLREMSQELGRILSLSHNNLRNAPEGKLRISHTRGFPQYYWCTRDTGPGGRYLARDQLSTARKLSQKEYDTKVADLAAKQKRAIDRLLHNAEWGLEQHRIEQIPARMHPLKRQMISPYAVPTEEFVTSWESATYARKPFSDDAPTLLTERGERVRSKSEIIIANALLRNEIPYHYEKPLLLSGDTTIHPDFTVLNTRTRRTFFWEHLGMMDDATYCSKALLRIARYNNEGYFPGINLILTFETAAYPLDTNIIRKTIEAYLL